MMPARTMMLTVMGGGTLMGLALGLTTNTAMLPSPEPLWRQAVPVHPSPAYSYQLADSRPQDLSPTWYFDRMPTWKRRTPAQAGYTIEDLGYPMPSEPLLTTDDPPPEPPQELAPPAIEPRGPTPLDAAAAEAELAAQQSGNPVAAGAQQPAAQEPAPTMGSIVVPAEAGA